MMMTKSKRIRIAMMILNIAFPGQEKPEGAEEKREE